MRHLIYTYLFLSILFIFSSCSKKQYQTLFSQRTALPDSLAQKRPVTLNTYQIQPQDVLQIRNLQNIKYIVDDMPATVTTTASGGGNTGVGSGSGSVGQSYQVEEDSTVGLPVIGRIKVVGLTRSEAQKLIEEQYRKILLKDPIIELKITNLKVTVLGEIKLQGNFPLLKDKTTLVELIGEAGGLTDKANQSNIKIIRGTEKKPVVIEVDVNNISSINDPKTVLQNGDIIYIAQNPRAIRNEGLQTTSLILQPLLILLNTALVIFTLIRR